jgi:hypothetical protein
MQFQHAFDPCNLAEKKAVAAGQVEAVLLTQ